MFNLYINRAVELSLTFLKIDDSSVLFVVVEISLTVDTSISEYEYNLEKKFNTLIEILNLYKLFPLLKIVF